MILFHGTGETVDSYWYPYVKRELKKDAMKFGFLSFQVMKIPYLF